MKSYLFPKSIKVICSLFMALCYLGCDIPKDSHGSWDTIINKGMIVGVVKVSGDSKEYPLIQKEKTLIEKFASQNNLQAKFVPGSETKLIESLKKMKIHVILGGFKKKNMLKKEVGMTTSYDSAHVLFIPKGENRLMYQLEKFIYNNK